MVKEFDRTYLQKIAEGDKSTFDYLFLVFYPRVKTFILNLVKNEDDAQDMAQDIFLKIWNNRKILPEIKNLQAYFFQMSKYQVYDYFKQNTAYEIYPSESTDTASFVEESFLNEIETKDLELLIDMTIENMPPQRKKIFTMSRKEGLTNDEIAISLDISKRTVETHISVALKDIRKIIYLITVFFM